ncbi:MAG: hypothetical protein V3T88_08745, partial [Nitrosomonadaceae bacterium]
VSSLVTPTSGNNIVRPFKIGLSPLEVLFIHKLRVMMQANAADATQNTSWMLIQKDERTSDDVLLRSGNPFTATGEQDYDHDLLVAGIFQNIVLTGASNSSYGAPQSDTFDPPIIIPRSPTFVLRSGNVPVTVIASLYYTKKKVSKQDVIGLLKKWVGRKQDVVSNVPPTIDE